MSTELPHMRRVERHMLIVGRVVDGFPVNGANVESEDAMSIRYKAACASIVGVVMGGLGFSVLHAQTKTAPAFWITETIEVRDQAAFLNAIKAVPPTVQAHGGRYIALGGKIVPGVGSPPKRVTIIQFDSLEKAQAWFNDPAAVAARTEALKHATVRDYTVEGLSN